MTEKRILLNLYASATTPFDIDDDLVTQRVSILGRTGSGKTYTAAVLVEELLGIRAQVIVIDPLDVWWGVRSSADGKRDGFPVVIFGGDHEDIPLREEDAKAIADAIVDHGFSCVLSISHLSMNGQRRFMTDFAERLFHRKHETAKRTPVHIVIDEADAFAPQKPQPGEQRMLGAIQALVRRGRSRGIGTTLISQRPAVVSKDVLTQTEVMIAHQLTGPHDKKAVQAWVEAHDEGKRGTEFMRSIIELERGEAWLWSPTWLKAFTRIKVRKRKTFDSSFTPKAGTKPNTPNTLAQVDLTALKAKLSNTIAEAAANDPAKLKARIKELEKLIPEAGKIVQPDEAAINARILEAVRAESQVVESVVSQQLHQMFVTGVQEMHASIDAIYERLWKGGKKLYKVDPVGVLKWKPSPAKPQTAARETKPLVRETNRPKPEPSPVAGELAKVSREILTAILQHANHSATRVKVAHMAGYPPSGSSMRAGLAELRRLGLIEGSDVLAATDAGAATITDVAPLPTGMALADVWRPKLAKVSRQVLDVLLAAHPKALTKQEISDGCETSYPAHGSSMRAALAELRKLELVDGRGDEIRASDVFFED